MTRGSILLDSLAFESCVYYGIFLPMIIIQKKDTKESITSLHRDLKQGMMILIIVRWFYFLYVLISWTLRSLRLSFSLSSHSLSNDSIKNSFPCVSLFLSSHSTRFIILPNISHSLSLSYILWSKGDSCDPEPLIPFVRSMQAKTCKIYWPVSSFLTAFVFLLTFDNEHHIPYSEKYSIYIHGPASPLLLILSPCPFTSILYSLVVTKGSIQLLLQRRRNTNITTTRAYAVILVR